MSRFSIVCRVAAMLASCGVAPCCVALGVAIATGAHAAADLDRMQRSTVRIICKSGDAMYSGSGFVVGDGAAQYVATNRHVAVCADSDAAAANEMLRIVLAPGDAVPVQIVWQDANLDLAVLRPARTLGRPNVRLADTTSVVAGAPVTVVGFPGAADDVIENDEIAVPTVTQGSISRVIIAQANGVRYFQHSAATNPGNSGGPVFNEDGNVIGINSRKALTNVATVTAEGVSSERVANGEGIALAIDAAELVPHLQAAGIPFLRADSDAPIQMAMIVMGAGALLLLTAGTVMVATPGRRQVFLKRIGLHRVAPAPAGFIRITDGVLAGTAVPLSDRIVLGRDPAQSNLVFPIEDTSISRRHCDIRYDGAGGAFEVRDLGSRNGTFVTDAAGKPRRLPPNSIERVKPGQHILLGSPRNRLLLELR